MSNEGKLFVGGISYDTTEETLTEAFDKYGIIRRVDVIKDRTTGRPRGFAFVTFENAEDAKDAMEAMDGKMIDGRAIRVDEAGKGGGSRRGSDSQRGGYVRGGRGRGYPRGGFYGGDRSEEYRGYRSGDNSFGRGYSRENRGQGGYGRDGTYYDL